MNQKPEALAPRRNLAVRFHTDDTVECLDCGTRVHAHGQAIAAFARNHACAPAIASPGLDYLRNRGILPTSAKGGQ